MVTAPVASAPRWAAASMPYAPPETTVQPRSPRSAAISPATCAPYPVAALDPTIETERRQAWRKSAWPRSHSAYGRAVPSSSSRPGHCGSAGQTRRMPSRRASARPASSGSQGRRSRQRPNAASSARRRAGLSAGPGAVAGSAPALIAGSVPALMAASTSAGSQTSSRAPSAGSPGSAR